MCGVTIRTRGDEVIDVRGDPEDPFSQGYICPKAVGLKALHEDPDRRRRPLVRGREVDWSEALGEAARGLRAVRRAHGEDAIAVYQGNPTIHNLGLMTYGQLLVRRTGTRHRYSATSVDQLPAMLTALEVFGNQVLLPVPDIDRADLLVVIGANPVVSHGSLMTAPNVKARLRALRERGGRLVVIDPRRTETATVADAHHFIRPGTDALLLMAWLNTLFAEGLVQTGHLTPHIEGIDALRQSTDGFTPEAVAPIVGIQAGAIRDLARTHATTDRAVLYGRLGVSVHPFGGLCGWLLVAINAVTRHLDREGGQMFTTPALDVPALAERTGERGSFDRYRSEVGGLPEFGGELPVATLAEEIEAGHIRALLTIAGNPVLSTPDGPRTQRALEKLDFMVSIDPYTNETTRHADVQLPPASALCADHFDAALNLVAVRNVARYAPAVFDPPPGARRDWEICLDLWSRLEAPGKALPAALRALLGGGPRRWIDLGLRAGPYPLTVSKLAAHPHGLDLGPLQPVLVERLRGRRIQLAPERFIADLPRLRATLEDRAPELVLIGRRTLRSNNSWMHNLPLLVRGPERCVLLMHPEDARHNGIEGRAIVESDIGTIEVPVVLTEDLMRGVVCLPHGWGHHRPGAQLSVAAQRPGASYNDLTDARRVDPLSGTSALNGLSVRVRPV